MGNTKKTRINFEFAGGKLKEARERKGLSRAQLAKILKVDKTSIANWENKKSNPSFENLREMSYFFGVDDNYWKLSDKPKVIHKEMEYDGHKPEDLILSLNEFKDLKNRIVFLEEKIETLTRHDDILIKRVDELEKRLNGVAEDSCGLDNRMDELEANSRADLDWQQLAKALAKVVSNQTTVVPYSRSYGGYGVTLTSNNKEV